MRFLLVVLAGEMRGRRAYLIVNKEIKDGVNISKKKQNLQD